MAEDEVQAHRDWMVQLLRKLETEKGLSREQAMKLVYDMADKEKVRDWLVQHLQKATPEEQEAFVQKVLAHVDIDDLDEDDHEPQGGPETQNG